MLCSSLLGTGTDMLLRMHINISIKSQTKCLRGLTAKKIQANPQKEIKKEGKKRGKEGEIHRE